MIDKFNFIKRYFRFRLKATNKYNIHSPFVYSFYNQVIGNQNKLKKTDTFRKISQQTGKIFTEKTEITFHEIGANNGRTKTTTVGKHSKKISLSAKTGRILSQLIRTYKPDNILELGTGAGISTLYLAAFNPEIPVVTIEGNMTLAENAKKLFKFAEIDNIRLISGLFEEMLPLLLQETKNVGFVFIDGNHQKKAVLNYFNMLKPYINEFSIIVFHDIYWSDEMFEAWNEILSDQNVTVSVDLFFIGIVFFRRGISKQNLRFKI